MRASALGRSRSCRKLRQRGRSAIGMMVCDWYVPAESRRYDMPGDYSRVLRIQILKGGCMQSFARGPVESALLGPKILEQSEGRRRATEILARRFFRRHQRFFRNSRAVVLWFSTVMIGVGVGALAYADLNTYHPEMGRLWIYVMAAVGCVTGCAALATALLNARRLDAVATLLFDDGVAS